MLVSASLLLGAVLVQVTWAPALTIAGAFPNLVLLLVVAATWVQGVRAGMLWACGGGVMLDLTAPGPLGPHALALLGGAYAAGYWVRNFDDRPLSYPVIATAFATALYCLTILVADRALGLPVPPVALAWELTVAAVAYNATAMLAALTVLRVAAASKLPRAG